MKLNYFESKLKWPRKLWNAHSPELNNRDIQCVNNIVKYLNRHLEYPKVSKLLERIHFLTVKVHGIKAELDGFWADKVEMGEISKPELKKLNAVVFLVIFFKIDIKRSELAC